MLNHKNGGPAFPRSALGEDAGRTYGQQDGMNLRDWFAGQCLAGQMASYAPRELFEGGASPKEAREILAKAAYAIADAMLAARQ